MFYKKRAYSEVFLQPKQVRRLRFSDWLVIAAGVYALWISSASAQSIPAAALCALYLLARFIVPPFLKRENATVTDDYIRLDSKHPAENTLYWNRIADIQKMDDSTIRIVEEYGTGQRTHTIPLDAGQADKFLQAVENVGERMRQEVQRAIEKDLD